MTIMSMTTATAAAIATATPVTTTTTTPTTAAPPDNNTNNNDEITAAAAAAAAAIIPTTSAIGVPPSPPPAAVPSSSCPRQPPLPVDRDWIKKLLLETYPASSDQSRPPHNRDGTALVVAPMVDQSDLPFRLLCRRYGANLCYTPMIHAGLLVRSEQYRNKFLPRGPHNNHIATTTDDNTQLPLLDRPLIGQLCGHDPATVLAAAQLLAPYVDGIDLNCGCPQNIARRGKYGAYLLEQEQILVPLVRHLAQHLRIPFSIKVRLLPAPFRNFHINNHHHNQNPTSTISTTTTTKDEDDEDDDDDDTNQDATDFDIATASLQLYGKLVEAGVHLLTIHGRTRHQKQDLIGRADWTTIKKAVELYGHQIPIFANGSIESYEDIAECFRYTKVDGVMSSEAVLEYPPIFYKVPQTTRATTATAIGTGGESTKTETETKGCRTIGRLQLAKEYLELAQQYPPEQGGQGSGLKCIRGHIHRFLHEELQQHVEFRQKVIADKSFAELYDSVHTICPTLQQAQESPHSIATETLSWYHRHRTKQKLIQQQQADLLLLRQQQQENNEDDDDDNTSIQECGVNIFANGHNDGDY